jgi:Mn2+/Fe2+ NRAMP family transporter
VRPDWGGVLRGLLVPAVPEGGGAFLLGVVGGVGGSVTLLSYSYWIRERGWDGPAFLHRARLDLAVAYVLTGIFGVALMVVAAGAPPAGVEGRAIALALARQIEAQAGPAGRWIFLVGFWGAVFTSMLGVWQGVPYLFADFVQTLHRPSGAAQAPVDTRSRAYRGYLLFIGLPPLLLLLTDRPVWIVLVYSVAGAFFMPFLAATLLYLNNRARWVGPLRNGWRMNLVLALALVLFAYLCFTEIAGAL